MNDASDAELLRRYLNDGEELAFAHLARRYLGLVYHAALRQAGSDAHAAEEISQTVFTVLARKAASLAGHEALVGWLYTTTRYTACVYRRRESRRLRREQESRIMHQDAITGVDMSDWDRLRPLIDDVLDELTANDRDAILLRFFTGLSFAEIGARLKMSENGARMRVERALEKLHVLLGRRGVTSTTAALGVALTTQAMASAPSGLAVSVTGAALTGTASAGVWLTTGIFVMKMKTVILSAAAVLAVGVALFQFDRAQDAELLLAVANRDRDALREQLRGSPPLVVAVPQTASAGSVQPSRMRQDMQANAGASAGSSLRPPIIAKIANVTDARIQSFDAQYLPLYRRLGLTAGQSEKFRAILMNNARRNEELMKAAALNSKLDLDKQRTIDDQTNAELIASVRDEFGESAVQAMEQHERTMPFRSPLDDLAKALFYTDAPLTPAQAEQLLDAVIRHEQVTQGKVDFDWMVQPDLFGAMLTQSDGILSAKQIDALRKVTEQSLAQKHTVVKKAVRNTTGAAIQFSPVGGETRPGS